MEENKKTKWKQLKDSNKFNQQGKGKGKGKGKQPKTSSSVRGGNVVSVKESMHENIWLGRMFATGVNNQDTCSLTTHLIRRGMTPLSINSQLFQCLVDGYQGILFLLSSKSEFRKGHL